ncbi:hypothetical protein QFZ49_005879 [Streptomyces turgidiscabies]|uniref:Uncharacterized protein n=1 Tax=Streptomyces turgidiscabies TaxID=85558 RepID=A0ABU0RV87_9ACTN|nr:hypothetical protein [Streptomyces turgidiscabies]
MDASAGQFTGRQFCRVESAQARRRDEQDRRVQQFGRVRKGSALVVEPYEQSAGALHQYQVVLGGQFRGGLGHLGRSYRRQRGPAGGRGGGQRVRIAGEFEGSYVAREPRDLVGVTALVRTHSRLRGFEHGDRAARRERRGGDGGRGDGLADLRARPRDHQDRHVRPSLAVACTVPTRHTVSWPAPRSCGRTPVRVGVCTATGWIGTLTPPAPPRTPRARSGPRPRRR